MNGSSAKNSLAIVQDYGLTRRYGSLWSVKRNFYRSVKTDGCCCRLFHLAVSDFRFTADRLFGSKAGNPIEVGCNQRFFIQIAVAPQCDRVRFGADLTYIIGLLKGEPQSFPLPDRIVDDSSVPPQNIAGQIKEITRAGRLRRMQRYHMRIISVWNETNVLAVRFGGIAEPLRLRDFTNIRFPQASHSSDRQGPAAGQRSPCPCFPDALPV